MEGWTLFAIFLATTACILSVCTLFKVANGCGHVDYMEHLSPDAVLEARRLMRQDLENFLDEKAKAIHLDLQRDIQAKMYKEIADFRKWMSHQAPE